MTPWRLAASLVLALAAPPFATAQGLPDGPLTLGDGRLVIGGQASVSASTDRDDPGWFNYTDYEHNTLRLFRVALSASLRATDRLTVLGEIRTENGDAVRPYALYLRLHPWADRPIDIQVGRIPPTFGAFSRRAYETDNPLIGYPLAYQYLTTIRPDALPATVDDLVAVRGRGWLVDYPLGAGADEGLPLVTAFQWDTGVQVRVGRGPIEASGAVTTGTLGDPRVGDDNDGKQVSARVMARPVTGLVVGASAARGAYLSRRLSGAIPDGAAIGDFTQRALGFDVEYSRGYWLLRSEVVWSAWGMPRIGDLSAAAWSTEGRYKIGPGLFVAGRVDRLDFGRVDAGSGRLPWDAPVRRVEVGGGYYLRRNIVGKLVYQYNWRDSDQFRRLGLGAAQLQVWF